MTKYYILKSKKHGAVRVLKYNFGPYTPTVSLLKSKDGNSYITKGSYESATFYPMQTELNSPKMVREYFEEHWKIVETDAHNVQKMLFIEML